MQLSKTAVYAEVRSLTKAIQSSPISKERYQLLSQRLDNALKALNDLETEGRVNKLFNSHLRELIVNLYRDLDEGRVHLELSRIQAGSRSIRGGRITKKAFLSLKKRIDELEASYKGSVEERRIIAEAKLTLSRAGAKLKSGLLTPEETPEGASLSVKKKQAAPQEFTILPGDIEELFEIAEAIFYHRNADQTKARYHALPLEQRRRVEEHLEILGSSGGFLELIQEPVRMMQALVATANELVGNDEGYPTLQQIRDLFDGLSKLDIPSHEESKIIQLTTNVLTRHG
jgi:hypothetical protein